MQSCRMGTLTGAELERKETKAWVFWLTCFRTQISHLRIVCTLIVQAQWQVEQIACYCSFDLYNNMLISTLSSSSALLIT